LWRIVEIALRMRLHPPGLRDLPDGLNSLCIWKAFHYENFVAFSPVGPDCDRRREFSLSNGARPVCPRGPEQSAD
jgi:hypothetical protein